MTRIIAGSLRGRSLAVPPKGTRPTSDRVREAVFSSLDARGVLDRAVLDLYAGSGALGFEALSRGASRLTAVEAGPPAVKVLRANARALGLRPEIIAAKVATFLARGIATVAGAPFGVVLMDPPYDVEPDGDLAALAEGDWLEDGALVVLERSVRSADPVFPEAFAEVSSRRYGETVVWYATFEQQGRRLGA